MESVGKIRRLVLRDGRSIRSVSRETGLSRNTIKKYLEDGSPPSYKRSSPRPRPQLSGFEDLLEQAYRADLKRPRRDRRTALKLYEFVVGKGYKGSYSPVQRFIRDLKRADGVGANAFVPLQFDAGDAMQFDWSQEYVVLGGVRQKVHVAHFRLCHSRKPFVVAYPGESQEMVLDAFTRASTFFGGVPRRVIIDNPKTMVVYVSRSKDRVFHPRFLALMSHYVMEPVACTPASGWEKGQVENQVQHVRGQMFAPPPSFDDLDELNIWLEGQCERLAGRPHPEQRDRKVNDVFADEFGALHPLGRPFDGYVEKTVRVLSTCLVQYDSNRYSVPSDYAGRHVSLRVYANRIVATADQKVVAEHKRRFTRNASYFEPWHYVPLPDRKPGALRDGAPFKAWALSDAMHKIRTHYMKDKGGDRDFVDLLLLAQEHGIEAVEMACELAVEQSTLRLPAIVNLINQLVEPVIAPLAETCRYPQLADPPEANCERYEELFQRQRAIA